MTLIAQRYGAREIIVGHTYGPVSTQIREDYAHVRHFWSQLGELIKECEADEKAELAAREARAAEEREVNTFLEAVLEETPDA
jgi:hypothetical protein